MPADQFQTLSLYVLAAIGLILFGYDLFIRRRGHTEETEFRQQHLKSEAEFRRDELAHRKRVWEGEEEQAKRLISRFDTLIEPVATKLKEELVSDTQWLLQSLQRSELFPYEDTIFGQRSTHFLEEKNSLARMFIPYFVTHLEELCQESDHVCLFIDSGTTLYPFFDVLAQVAMSHRTREPRPKWIDKVEIVTNNLPGVLRLMRHERPMSNDGVASLALPCTMVSGQLLTEYVALTGPDAEASIEQIVQDRKDRYGETNCKFLAFVTGNWIRLRRNNTPCPVPLARGLGHLEFKQRIMHHANEVYVIAPLAKIFVGIDLKEINRVLGRRPGDVYKEIMTNDKDLPIKVENVRLVTTVRTSRDSILRAHSSVLASRFKISANPNSHKVELGNPRDHKPVFLPFDPVQTDIEEQKKIEFPHAQTRKPEFFKLFSVQ